ncbi:MAG: CBS domain-containing protein [Deltaproteobacteria bacterium]|nr:CBS domain-containing protein [Deltaproteobacteria bacterium]
MLVREIMDNDPAAIGAGASLAEALKEMARHKTKYLVVKGKEDVVGILSDGDLGLYYGRDQSDGSDWERMTVQEIMSPRPLTVGSSENAGDAARTMLREAVSALPVVDNGVLVGLLSDREFTRYFARH